MLNSAWLNESATLFRLKYYQNGAHAGYIMYMTDAVLRDARLERSREFQKPVFLRPERETGWHQDCAAELSRHEG